jgi:hypothetical protein
MEHHMTNILLNGTPHTTKSFFDQWVDGEYQYDPLAGGRAGFLCYTYEYGSEEHVRVANYIQTHATVGMVTMFRQEHRGYRKRNWTRGPVKFEFEHRGVALLAHLHVVGDA